MAGSRFQCIPTAGVGALAMCASLGAFGAHAAFADTTYSAAAATAPNVVTNGVIPAGALSVVNFHPAWGDKEANKASMLKCIDEAHAAGVRMIVFPEMALTSYVSSSDPDSAAYRMAMSQSETISSPTTRELADKAAAYGMWVVFGTSERIPGDADHTYNSALAASPDGKVVSYQKIAPVEGSWATPGTTPALLQTEWGLAGLSICYDTCESGDRTLLRRAGRGHPHQSDRYLPQLPRHRRRRRQGRQGMGMVLTATVSNRLRRATASSSPPPISSAPTAAPDGDGKQPYDFPGGSVIVRGSAYYSAAQNADGSLIVGTEGALANSKDLRVSYPSTTRVANDSHPDYYAKWYAELADKQESGTSLSNYYGPEDGPRVAVANVAGVWADKQANVDMMVRYAEQAAADDVDLLVFPETVLTGYDSTDPKDDANAHSANADVNRALAASDDYMQVLLAEKVKGADGDDTRGVSVRTMADTAKRLGMYIVFGLPEMPDGGPIADADGVRKVYNSAAVVFPDGHTESFQKMHRAGQEKQVWSVPGNTPRIFEMPEFTGSDGGALKAGISICRDGHFYPELGRYYAASGAELLIHPTATTGDPWYRESRIGSYTDSDGLAAVTANLWGQDGYPLDADGNPIYSVDANGDTVSSGKEIKGYNYMGVGRDAFRSRSLIITAWDGKDGTPFDYATGSALDTSGTGGSATPQITKDWAFGGRGEGRAQCGLRRVDAGDHGAGARRRADGGTDDVPAKDANGNGNGGAATPDEPLSSDKTGADGSAGADASAAGNDGATRTPLSTIGLPVVAFVALAIAVSGAGVPMPVVAGPLGKWRFGLYLRFWGGCFRRAVIDSCGSYRFCA